MGPTRMIIERDDADWIGRGECVETDSGAWEVLWYGSLMGESLMTIGERVDRIWTGEFGRQMSRLQVLYPAQ